MFSIYSLTESPHLWGFHLDQRGGHTETHTKRDRASGAETPAIPKALSFSLGFFHKSHKQYTVLLLANNCIGKTKGFGHF